MSKIEFELNRNGVRDLMKGDHTKAMLERIGSNAVGRLGEGYGTRTNYTPTRLRVGVFADSYEAKKDNLEHNSILKAVRFDG